MKILVCIKQICVSGIEFKEGDRWITVKRGGTYAISRFDEHALEAAIQIKEAYNAAVDNESGGGSGKLVGSRATVDALSMGPERVTESLRRAMGIGADRGIHLVTAESDHGASLRPDGGEETPSGYIPGGVTARSIADFLREPPAEFFEYIECAETGPNDQNTGAEKKGMAGEKIPYDLILTGIMSEDLMQAQVGPMVAEHLGIPCITSVVDIRHPWGISENGQEKPDEKKASPNQTIKPNNMDLTVHRELEGGVRQEVSARFPLLLTIQAGINQPRYPSFSNLFKAKKRTLFSYPIHQVDRGKKMERMGRSTSMTNLNLIRLEHPKKKRAGKVLDGTIDKKAEQLMGLLKGKGLI